MNSKKTWRLSRNCIEFPLSTAIIAPGPWSPVTTTSAGKGWDTENR